MAFAVLVVSATGLKAQVTAVNGSLTAACCFQTIRSVNCDMVEVGGNDKLWAAVYHGTDNGSLPLSQINIYLNNSQLGGGSLALAGGNNVEFPDVAIVNKYSGGSYSATEYVICVVFQYNYHIYLQTWDVDLGASPVTVNGNFPVQVCPNNPLHFCELPHIDAFSVRNASTNGANALHSIAMAWTEAFDDTCIDLNQTPPDTIIYRRAQIMTTISDDLVTMNQHDVASYDPFTYCDENMHEYGYNSDIAAIEYLNTQTGGVERSTYILYTSGATFGYTDINLAKLDYDYVPTFALAKNITTLDNTHHHAWQPRIDGQNLYNPASMTIPWQGAVEVSDPLSPVDFYVALFNDVVAYDVCSLGSGQQHGNVAITGRGATGYAGIPGAAIGRDQYSVGYYSTYTHNSMGMDGDFFVNAVDIGGPNVGVMNGSYYEVSNTDMKNNITVSTLPDTRIALATSANTGEGLLTVWAPFEIFGGPGWDLEYKLTTSTTYAYRTSDVDDIKTKPTYRVYPNPAKTSLTVDGIRNSAYTITNAIGQIITSGNIDGKNPKINITELPVGVYLLNLNENTYSQNVKFVKQ